jgi:hypothetical protein
MAWALVRDGLLKRRRGASCEVVGGDIGRITGWLAHARHPRWADKAPHGLGAGDVSHNELF